MATINIFYRTPTQKTTKVASFDSSQCTLNDFCNHIIHAEGLDHHEFLLATGTKVIRRSSCSLKNTLLPADSHVDILIPTLGGKGGFGSLLRAIGAQIEKTTNRDACRDLSGRRLRDIKREDELKKLVALQEKLQEERKRRKREKLEKLKKSNEAAQTGSSIQELVAMFEDQDYNKRRMELSDIIEAAVDKGIINFKKRQQEETEVSEHDKKKKICLEESAREVSIDDCLATPKEALESSECDANIDTNDKKVKLKPSVVSSTKKTDLWLGLEDDEETC